MVVKFVPLGPNHPIEQFHMSPTFSRFLTSRWIFNSLFAKDAHRLRLSGALMFLKKYLSLAGLSYRKLRHKAVGPNWPNLPNLPRVIGKLRSARII